MSTRSRVSGKELGLGEGVHLTLCSVQLQSTIEDEARRMTFPSSHEVTGLLGFESRKTTASFIFISIIFPGHVMTLEKWTEELDRPMHGFEATIWYTAMKPYPPPEGDGEYQSPVRRGCHNHCNEKGQA